jgi:PAT family beta-lactamase induction signal transducer AmpG
MVETQNKYMMMLRGLMEPRLLAVFLLGIASGLPLALTGATLQAWMVDENVDLKTIGIFSLVGMPYTYKFFWASAFDRVSPGVLDRRRGWILWNQLALIIAIVALGFQHPSEGPYIVAALAVLIAFLSSSQDIVIDAYRVEILPPEQLGLGASLGVTGYRLGMLLSGGIALGLAGSGWSWQSVYILMASILLPALLVTVFWAPSPVAVRPPRNFRETIVDPFIDFFKRTYAVEVLIFIILYKIGDVFGTSLMTAFMMKMSYTKLEIAAVAKGFGILATIGGGLMGGAMMLRLTLGRALLIFGIFQALSTMSFMLLIDREPSQVLLTFVIAFENITGGMGNAAFAALLARLCNKRFTAFQYALLSSLFSIPRVFVSAPSGWIAEQMGWWGYYSLATAMAIPGLLMLMRFKRWEPTIFPQQ